MLTEICVYNLVYSTNWRIPFPWQLATATYWCKGTANNNNYNDRDMASSKSWDLYNRSSHSVPSTQVLSAFHGRWFRRSCSSSGSLPNHFCQRSWVEKETDKMVGCPWIYQQNTRIIRHVYDFMASNIMNPLGIKVNDKLPHILIGYLCDVFSHCQLKGIVHH